MSTPRRPNRYELPMTAMGGALLVVLVVVVVVVGLQVLSGSNQSVPQQAVPYQPVAARAKHDKRLVAFSPPELPAGWHATSVSYVGGPDATWHLGVLTSQTRYIGIDESLSPASQMIAQYAGDGATKGLPVRIGKHVWQSWTNPRGDYLLVLSIPAPAGDRLTETVVVGGAALQSQVVAYASSLR